MLQLTEVVDRLDVNGFRFGTAISLQSSISLWASVGAGYIIDPFATVLINAAIDKHLMVHSQVVVEHGTSIEDDVNPAPGTSLGRNVTVSTGAHMYTGASVKPGVTAGSHAIVGAGPAGIESVPDYATVAGVPARKTRSARPRNAE